ncbi:hypothetical protein [Pseudomonas brassicacearum]|uniref:hypothetical protein n=1 Tax=Pseudomonas brassicacearum TaxID=930166 RepID=UPI0004080AC4|nr:hypothetical protein [Pseudomonas brassicacearum]
MSDQQLLELAAKAAGMDPPFDKNGVLSAWVGTMENGHWWDPLNDDGDALRLAIKLGICIVFMEEHDSVGAEHSLHGVMIIEAMDDFGTRRAIVRAAAEIGKATP